MDSERGTSPIPVDDDSATEQENVILDTQNMTAAGTSRSNASEPSQSQGRYVSNVWQYFTRTATGIMCNKCPKEYGLRSGTSTLRFHLRSCSPLVDVTSGPSREADASANEPSPVRSRGRRQSRITSYAYTPTRKASKADQELYDKVFVQMLWMDLRPFHFLECEGFKRMVEALNPTAVVKSRRTYVRMLEQEYAKRLAKLIDILSSVKTASVCFDYWTSAAKHAYITVTLHWITDTFHMEHAVLGTVEVADHHTAQVTAEKVSEITCHVVPNCKINCFVTDNASNVSNVGQHLNWENVRCFGHTLQLALNDGLKLRSIAKCIASVKALVNFFNSSHLATADLRRRQGDNNPDGESGNLSLEGYNKTRWDSVYKMLERVDRLKWTIRAVLSNPDVVDSGRAGCRDLSDEDWVLVGQLVS